MTAMAAQALDPFQGTIERRVIPEDMSVYDMEEYAAKEAIERSGVNVNEIDVLLTYTLVPDYWLSNPACTLHDRLGLRRECFAMHTDAATYSFMMQLSLAESLIAAGRARFALLVQSCAATRLIGIEDPGCVLVGDGAAAAVVGPVASERGVIASAHFTDGRYPRSLIAGVPGGRWFEGRSRMHIGDRDQMYEVFVRTADVCKQGVDAVLDKTETSQSDIDFLCVYQGTPWLGEVVQDYLGLRTARTVETFTRFGYISAAMIPANLYFAEKEGVLGNGDLAILTGGGTGMTYGATLLRWGR